MRCWLSAPRSPSTLPQPFRLTAARRGVPYAIVNRGPTEHDGLPEVTVRVEGDVGVIFPSVIARLQAGRSL